MIRHTRDGSIHETEVLRETSDISETDFLSSHLPKKESFHIGFSFERDLVNIMLSSSPDSSSSSSFMENVIIQALRNMQDMQQQFATSIMACMNKNVKEPVSSRSPSIASGPRNDVIFVDVQTTGLSHTTDRIIRIELVCSNSFIAPCIHLVNPKMQISSDCERKHGILNSMLQGHKTFKQIAPEVLAFLSTQSRLGVMIS